ncbi:MAG: arsenosugar biosynthesis radical SAM protein ArsS [Gammaproteobacteria bacterium]
MDTSVHHDFQQTLKRHGAFPLRRAALSELQVNLGYLCNQACEHCHVEAGPKRTEIMTSATMQKILAWAAQNQIERADLTGGAPELIPGFRDFVDGLRELGIAVTSRCNLTVLFEPGQRDLAKWYAARGVRLVCSLPCYTAANVEAQRGKGVFGKSIAALQLLNSEGYGRREALRIDLVYNPLGAALPPPQAGLELDYKTRLKEDFGIDFNSLLTLTNLPINRFEHFLRRSGQLESYRQLLADNFNPATVEPLMCRHLISVDWRGFVYDCDFNQMLELPMAAGGRRQLWEISRAQLEGAPIALGGHCFGCTAGAGSSCGGALT